MSCCWETTWPALASRILSSSNCRNGSVTGLPWTVTAWASMSRVTPRQLSTPPVGTSRPSTSSWVALRLADRQEFVDELGQQVGLLADAAGELDGGAGGCGVAAGYRADAGSVRCHRAVRGRRDEGMAVALTMGEFEHGAALQGP